MRIVLNLAMARGFGSGAVCRGILQGLSANSEDHRYLAWIPKSWQDNPVAGDTRFELRRVRAGIHRKFWVENISIRKALRSWSADRMFSLSDTSLPLCSVPHLVMVQQAYLSYGPEEWGFVPPQRVRLKMALMATYFAASKPSVDLYTVQTEDMKDHLAGRWNIPLDRISVIPTGLSRPLTIHERTETSTPPYVTYVSYAGPHKNHTVLAEMMAVLGAKYPDLRCKLTVKRQDVPALVDVAQRANSLHRFDFLGAVNSDEAIALTNKAVVTVIPSLLESFGMTYYEAMSAACPIVAADRGFAREACGDAALFAHPHSGSDFAERVDRILSSSDLSRRMGEIATDRVRANIQPWDGIAQKYLELLAGMRS